MSVLSGWKPLTGVRLLFADDSADCRALFKTHLTRAGADVVEFPDGESAVAAFGSAGAFDAALLDLTMPGLTGIETASDLRSRGFAGALVGITARATTDDVEAWLAAGCEEVLRKDVAPRDLVAAVLSACARHWVSLGRVPPAG